MPLLSGHHLPRPQNIARSLMHLSSGFVALAVIQLTPTHAALVALAATFAGAGWTMEVSRRFSTRANDLLMKLFGPVAHEHEREHVNSATWYATALLLLALFCPPLACSVAVMVLGFADPVAAIVGRRWGTIRLRSGRSLQGSLGFVAAALGAGLATTAVFYPTLPLPSALVLVGGAALVGALTELFSTKWDDNFSIPVAVAASVSLLAATLNMPIPT